MESSSFKYPKRRLTSAGRERRVGVEIEYGGVGLRETAELIQKLFGGVIKSHHRFAFKVESTRYGDFDCDSDASFVRDRKWQKYLDALGLAQKVGPAVDDIVAAFSDQIAPFEITAPPIDMSRLGCMDELRNELRACGAVGTHAHFFTAYGLQFNPEMPDLRPETILGYLRAFLLKYDSLLATEDIPLVRRMLPFIDPFPLAYVDQVLDPTYKPSLNGLMRDYLEMNPTRNRALDFLPLFAHINKDIVFEYPVEKELIKPRPTLHYRLPSSLIDDPSWSLASEWNKWVVVEDLAEELSNGAPLEALL